LFTHQVEKLEGGPKPVIDAGERVHQHQARDAFRLLQSHLLGDHASHRNADNVNRRQAHLFAEFQAILRQIANRIRGFGINRLADVALIDGKTAKVAAKRFELSHPGHAVAGQPVQEKKRRALAALDIVEFRVRQTTERHGERLSPEKLSPAWAEPSPGHGGPACAGSPLVGWGFCIPILEAMAAKAPVIAAHAGALPETAGDAGLLFTPDDADELARRIGQVLFEPAALPVPRARQTPRVAIVSFRFGKGIVGGAELSLRRMAHCLRDARVPVEVFTTCTVQEHHWKNDLAPGTLVEDDLIVHRFAVDALDRRRHDAVVRRVLDNAGQVDHATEQEFVRQGIHSEGLMTELGRRIDEFDAILVGPYLAGLTQDIARAFPQKTLLAGCFHDEPIARLATWRTAYRAVGGLLFHSSTEKKFAELALGLNHPRSQVVGTWLDVNQLGDPTRGQQCAGAERYVLYCGRYSPQKNLPLLLEWAERYNGLAPGRLRFVFAGQGPLSLPRKPWCLDLGYVDEATKRDLLRGATALVHLSLYESLSLAALEALVQGTPLIVHAECPVLRDLALDSQAGTIVDSFESFRNTLDELCANDEPGKRKGEKGQAYVLARYASRGEYTDHLLDAVFSLRRPLRTIMVERGLARAAAHGPAAWREAFGQIIEKTLDAPPRPWHESWKLTPHRARFASRAGQRLAFIPLRIVNEGTHAASPDGPARRVLEATTRVPPSVGPGLEKVLTPLPGVLVPMEETSAVVRVAVPPNPGRYVVEIRCLAADQLDGSGPADAIIELTVVPHEDPMTGCCPPLLEAAQTALVEADRNHVLPDDYVDVTEGWFASWKRRIKRKLLGNFQHAYVDVLSRQQTAFNKAVLQATHQAVECCTLLDHALAASGGAISETPPLETSQAIERAVAAGRADEIKSLFQGLLRELAATRSQLGQVEKRLALLEMKVHPAAVEAESLGLCEQVSKEYAGLDRESAS